MANTSFLLFDIQFPLPSNPNDIMDKFGDIACHNISCSEDDQRCDELRGAIRLLRLQRKLGMLSDEQTRTCLKTMWSEWFGYGDEDEEES